MDHDQVTKQKAYDSAIMDVAKFYEEVVGASRQKEFMRVRESKFAERYAALSKIKLKIMSPKDYTVQEYCLACAIYSNTAKDLIRSVAIQMLPSGPTK